MHDLVSKRGEIELSSVSLDQIQKAVMLKFASFGSHKIYAYSKGHACDRSRSFLEKLVEKVLINLQNEKIYSTLLL